MFMEKLRELEQWFGKCYRRFEERGAGPKHTLLINGVLLAIGVYIPIKKLTGFSFAEWLSNIFNPSFTKYVLWLILGVIIYASVIRLLLLVVEVWPSTPVAKIELEGIAACVLRVNKEIETHMDMITSGVNGVLPSLLNAHRFELNIGLVTEGMAEHILSCVKAKQFRKRDLFISVYEIPEFRTPVVRTELTYVTHYPENRSNITTRGIALQGNNHADFYCVRCIREGLTCFIRSNCHDYAKGKGKRKKSIKHFIGFSLKANDTLLGFINVEFHEKCFDSDEDLEAFAVTNLMAYKFLIEYQFLKRRFFRTVHAKINEQSS